MQMFFGTPHRAMDEQSRVKSVTNIFSATYPSRSVFPDLPADRIEDFSDKLPQVTNAFLALYAKYSIVNIYQGNDQGPLLVGEFAVSSLLPLNSWLR